MKILLVEDRPEDAELAKMALKNSGFEGKMDWVEDGEQAYRYLFESSENHEDLKLILMDVNLPKMSGIEILKNIKSSSLKHIPVVMLTTSEHPNDLKNAYKNYVNSYIKKPVSFNEFEKTFESIYQYWMNLNVHINK